MWKRKIKLWYDNIEAELVELDEEYPDFLHGYKAS